MAMVEVNGARLFYEETGTGEPVILIPGLGATSASFMGVTPQLAKRHRVIGVDLRGAGQSSAADGPYSMEQWADDVIALMNHLGLQRAHIVGSSLGGCVALVIADRAQHRVSSLVLAATFSETDALLELNYRVRIALIEATGMGALFADYAIALLFGRSFLETERGRAVAARTGAALRQNKPQNYIEHLRALLRFGRCDPDQSGEPKFTARLAKIDRPALVMCGDEDVLTVPKFSRILAAGLPRSELVILPGCGHANFGEQPDLSAAHLLRFLGRAKE